MSPHNLRIWALIQSKLVLIEAYKTENLLRERRNAAQAYTETDFIEVSMEIERLANSFENE